MELWVRSQDKERLIKVSTLFVEYNGDIDPTISSHRIVADKCIDLGIYKSKERALEILDEIQNFILCNKEYKYTTIASINELGGCYIYQMPSE